MATLTEQLDALIAEHRLSSITVSRIAGENGAHWAIYAQGDGHCASNPNGRNISPADALTDAITALNALRNPAVVVPDLAEAA